MSSILIISGPAGSGKNTVSERLLAEFKNVERIVTSTSRAPRGLEKNGVDYHFLTRESFEQGIKDGNFFEYAKVHDNYYGTSKNAVIERLGQGKDLILIIDVQGAETWRNIARAHPDTFKNIESVFIMPSGIDELRHRLAVRGTEDNTQIARRMQTAETEIACADKFDKVINSTTKDADYLALRQIYLDLKSRER